MLDFDVLDKPNLEGVHIIYLNLPELKVSNERG